MEPTRHIIIAGAGPAGLTAAVELLRLGGCTVTVYEADSVPGGISRTVQHHGNRIDIGGHRFFSKSGEVMRWWQSLLPLQTAPARDELLLGERMSTGAFEKVYGTPDRTADPVHDCRAMLVRRRVSRIYYLRRFFDYPVRLTAATLRNLGLRRTLSAGLGYLKACLHKRPEATLEDFYINRFGKPLYRMFFEDYTAKVWGLHPSELGADWGSQRVKGLSVAAILRDIASKAIGKRRRVETSLIEEFLYPRLGPGQLWEAAADEVRRLGGEVVYDTRVEEVLTGPDRRVKAVVVRRPDGFAERVDCQVFISSMPLSSLTASLRGIAVPPAIAGIAAGLPYRDFITVGLLLPRLAIKNTTRLRTVADRIPDTWIYVQERDVRLGRIQVFNNWSPYMVADFENTLWLGLEYFCSRGDELWNMTDAELTRMAVEELRRTGIIDAATDPSDAVCLRVEKAYPAYHGTYGRLAELRQFLDSIPNLYCVGRNGQHRYNNMDHSMLTAMAAARAAAADSPDHKPLWQVNTEAAYHEEK